MAFHFHPRTFYHPTESSSTSFTPLFRLLDDFDTYSRQNGKSSSSSSAAPRRQQQQQQQVQLPQWQPKFDVRETETAYELHGELPGVAKEAVHIEFSDPQTLLVRGKSERTYTAGTSPTETTASTKSVTEKAEGEEASSSSSRRNSYKATVEDEDEASERESGYEVVTTEEKKPEEKKQPVDRAKYWLTERSIGEFSRSFHFPTLVDYDGVSASFRDGILSIVVPKAKKHEAHRIVIN
ncbi:HSP20-like chaperone [Trichoderma citrinoviride]|uniref:HSP20-like chaperone n=1 Tax=Trichoderma citrinoviride TaxID=58853 RepID=A0A2T4BKY0_9HYPO|nr:HSP20-like chaperone [Trichoderma citrinoviride]PTB69920.1 HSP20-like chaperone [Trichoderma citrinoviride]